MTKINIYNNLTQKKELLIPIKDNIINLYLCGPTVYDYLHVGNFRGVIFFNLVRNFLEKSGYVVNFSYNYTDIDDKIINKAKESNKTEKEISEFFIKAFEEDFTNLNLKKHTYNPRVSEFIPAMINYIKKIQDNGLAYEVNGSIYLKRHSLQKQGFLSHNNIDEGLTSEKNDSSGKIHPSDFALWKKTEDLTELHWDSPWGKGRPGWHIECSVMAHELFNGQSIDIHGGGLDLLFPHHEAECVQCYAYSKMKMANYWMHNNMLNLNGSKMSKSLGNIQKGRDFMKDHSPELLKFIMLSSHYRSVIDFSDEQVARYEEQLGKIYYGMKKASGYSKKLESDSDYNQLLTKVNSALSDDFNTPIVMSLIYEGLNLFYKNEKKSGAFLYFMKEVGSLLSLFELNPHNFLKSIDDKFLKTNNIKEQEILDLIKERNQFRNLKDFSKADEIRNDLKLKNIELNDYKDSTDWAIIRK